jgi:hypothetical protein
MVRNNRALVISRPGGDKPGGNIWRPQYPKDK